MTELSLQQANRVIEAVLQAARERDMPPLAVAILDTGAHLKALQREDGVSFLRVQIAQAKAWGALAMSCNTDQLAERLGLSRSHLPRDQSRLASERRLPPELILLQLPSMCLP